MNVKLNLANDGNLENEGAVFKNCPLFDNDNSKDWVWRISFILKMYNPFSAKFNHYNFLKNGYRI